MKKILGLILVSSAFVGCMKKVDKVDVGNEFASAAFINASAGAFTAATSGNVFIDNIIQTSSAIAFRGVSSPVYLAVGPGSHQVDFVATTIDSTRLLSLSGQQFTARQAYTYVIYDTVTTGNRKLRAIRLTDDLTLPGNKDDSVGKIRFLHLAPNAPAVDVTFLRTNQGHLDSVTISNRTYIGNNPTADQIATLSNFNTILPLAFAGYYTIRVKLAGTQTLLVPATSFTLTTGAFGKSINTIYLAGGAQGQGLSVNNVRHYP